MVTALGCGPSDVGSTPTDHPSANRIAEGWPSLVDGSCLENSQGCKPSWVRIPGPPPNAAVAQRKSVRLLTGRPEVRLLPAVPHRANALVTQAGRVRSLKPRDGGASPPGGTNSVVAQPGRGDRSRACSVEVRLLSALPIWVRSSNPGEHLLRTQKRGSSNLPGSTKGLSSSGRTPRLQRGRRRFESGRPYQQLCVAPRRLRDLISPAIRDRYPATRPRPVRLGGSGRRFLRPDTAVRIRHGPPLIHRPGVAQQPEQRSDMPSSGGASPPPRTKQNEPPLAQRREQLRDRQTSGGSSPPGRTNQKVHQHPQLSFT